MSLLGIDLGTTGIKCAAFNEEGKILGKTYKEYNLYTPKPGIVELDPSIVWNSFCMNILELTRIIEVKKDPIEALAISVSGDEALPIDKKRKPLYNTIMSMDKRGQKENDWINNIIGHEKIYRITGQPPSPFYALNRLLWFKKNKPEIFSKIHKFLCWEDFMLSKLGSEYAMDYSVACRTLAFDIKNKVWSDKILKTVEVESELFSDTHASGTVVGKIEKKVAESLGLSHDVKLVTGGYDQVCAALGAGVTKPGLAAVGTGTMEVMQVCFDTPRVNKKMLKYGYSFCNHAIDGLYICLSINFCGGILLKWYKENFASDEKKISEEKGKDVYKIIIEISKKSKYPVLFLPYFEGAQTPRNNPDISGTILGLNLRSKKEDIIKGLLEGITFDLKLNLEKIEEAGIKINELYATGGGAKSDEWLQLKSDITGKIIKKLDIEESGCISSAILAGYGIGKFNSIQETVYNWVKVKKDFYPNKKKFKKYENKYKQFLDIYESLKKYKILY